MTEGPVEVDVHEEAGAPRSALTEGDDWLIISVSKIWVDRRAQRAGTTPSGGITITPPFGAEICLALAVDTAPKTPPPPGTMTLTQFESRVLSQLTHLVDNIVNVTPSDF